MIALMQEGGNLASRERVLCTVETVTYKDRIKRAGRMPAVQGTRAAAVP
jgi:hypothetical protein